MSRDAGKRLPRAIAMPASSALQQRLGGSESGIENRPVSGPSPHESLRQDVAVQTAVGVDEVLSSALTLCRLEKWASRQTAVKLHEVLVEQFIAGFKTAPKELVLDFDATDNPLYGQQEGRFFHGYYDSYCYLPLYVFCGRQLRCAYLRTGRIDGARHAAAILKLLVTQLRQHWPGVRLVFRGDSGFCRQPIINYCERAAVVTRNTRPSACTCPQTGPVPIYLHTPCVSCAHPELHTVHGLRNDTK